MPPEIIAQDDIKFAYNQKIDIIKHLTFKDNYYKPEQLQIIVDYSKVDTTRVGKFPVTIYAKDPSGNENRLTVTIEIYDNQAPEISIIKPFIIEPNTTINILEYIKVKDNVDDVVQMTLDDMYVIYDQIGKYPVWIHVEDQSGNRLTIAHEVEIKDTIKPVLILVSNIPIIEVHKIMTHEIILSYVLSYHDAFDLNPSITWIDDIDTSKIGTYHIHYKLKDASQNETNVTLKVMVQDLTAPNVSIKKSLIFDVFSQMNPLLTYFNIQDNYYDVEELTFQIKEDINVKIIGIYEIIIEVSDPSKNKKTYRFYAEIVDKLPPNLVQNEPIIISNFLRPLYSELLMYHDQYDKKGDISLHIEDHHIDYSIMGHHDIMIKLVDKSLNESEFIIQIIIMDMSPPTITLSHRVVYIDVEMFTFNVFDYIISLEDNQVTLTLDDVIVKHNVKEEIGKYEVFYEVFDPNGLSDLVSLSVIVMDNSGPIVEAADLQIKYGDMIDKEKGINISDRSEYTLIHLNTFDSNQIGHHVMFYVVYDKYGNETFFKRVITVEHSSILQKVEPYFTAIIVLTVGAGFTILLWFYYSRRGFDKNHTFEYNETMLENS
jgi:hypothetical protein